MSAPGFRGCFLMSLGLPRCLMAAIMAKATMTRETWRCHAMP
jgi:hypothetical protein